MNIFSRNLAMVFVHAIVIAGLSISLSSWFFAETSSGGLIAFGIAVVMAFISGLTLVYLMERPVRTLAVELSSMVAVDNHTDKASSKSMKAILQEMQQQVNVLANNNRQSLQQLSQATNELAGNAANLFTITERTERNTQRQQLETDQVATAMNEMNATVEEVARNTSEAAIAAQQADDAAIHGEQVARDAKHGIDELLTNINQASTVVSQLEAQSNDIGTVLDVIKTIAEQTNLLALNAAIEAARAGEQGRGFAVVADEVRTLATRTQSSTREIEEMINRLQGGAREAVTVMDEAIQKGQQGSDKVHDTLEGLGTILHSVRTINEMNAQIATAAEEQTQVANEINQNLLAIADVAERTTIDAQESRGASEKTAAISQKLQELVRNLGPGENGVLDLSSAKAAHLNWKTRLRAFLDGKATLSKEQAVSHRHCDFGKWYYSAGLENFGHLKSLQEVEAPHAKLHELIGRIIELKTGNQNQEAELAYQQVASLSEEIVAHLDKAEQEAAR